MSLVSLWSVVDCGDGTFDICTNDESLSVIVGASDDIEFGPVGCISNIEHARIIAAAPELFDVVQGILDAMDMGDSGHFRFNLAIAKEVIEKAKGKA